MTNAAYGRDADIEDIAGLHWRGPAELISIGFKRSRVVMMNEMHDGSLRCVAHRKLGTKLMREVSVAGCRYFAMEALHADVAASANTSRAVPPGDEGSLGLLAQPDMRDLVQTALDLGLTLIPYEVELPALPQSATMSSTRMNNSREKGQAERLAAAISVLPTPAKVFVWCGNGHLIKTPVDDWDPMGHQFRLISQIDAFAIDQTLSVQIFGPASRGRPFARSLAAVLEQRGRQLGILAAEAPQKLRDIPGHDAFIVSLDNDLT